MKRSDFLKGLVALVSAKPLLGALSKDLDKELEKKEIEPAISPEESARTYGTVTLAYWS